MAELNDKTPIAAELIEQAPEDGDPVGHAPYDDDNDSDCLSTTTSCTALGTSHPNIHSQTALSVASSSQDPSPSLPLRSSSISAPSKAAAEQPPSQQPQRPQRATSRSSSYDNPCINISDDPSAEASNAPELAVRRTSSPDTEAPTAKKQSPRKGSRENLKNSSSAAPSSAGVFSLGDSSNSPASLPGYEGTGGSCVPSSTSLPTSLKTSASASNPASGKASSIVAGGSSGTSSPIHGYGATVATTTPSSSVTATTSSSATTPLSGATAATAGNCASATSHSRGSSSVSGGGATSGAQTVCHSRGASTEGSTMDAFTSSATESRRGTYSEAGTLPIGSLPEGSLGGTIIEEEHPLEKLSEKKLSSDQSSGQREGDAGNNVDGSGKGALSRHMGSIGSSLKDCDCCRPILQKHNPLPTSPTRMDKMKYAFTCPPHGKVGVFLTYLLLMLLTWGSLYSIVGPMAAPGGTIFSLLVVFVCSVMAGKVSQACHLPPLLGMLLVGIALRSVPGIKVVGDSLDPEWSSSIRNIALVVILLRAGLGLDPVALKSMSLVVFRLAFTPCLVETTVVAIVTHFLLGFPWLWGFMLGFILAAVSPAVVVPCLLQLSQQGYGVAKGIPTLVIAAASVDDVLAISGFGVLLGMTFSQGSLAWQILQGPVEVLMGLTYGGVLGMLCWVLPNKHHQSCSLLQFGVLLTAGLFALFGSQKIEFGGAGALAVLCMAFIAGIGFRKQGWGDDDNPVGQHCNQAWTLLQPMLFALIGTEIQVLSLELDTIGYGLATLCVSLTIRLITTFFVVLGSGLNIRERLFVALAWLPKATVQAAIGSTALDYANRINASEDQITLAKQVLTIAVLVILITAPIGAIAIMTSAPRLLQRTRQGGAVSPDTV